MSQPNKMIWFSYFQLSFFSYSYFKVDIFQSWKLNFWKLRWRNSLNSERMSKAWISIIDNCFTDVIGCSLIRSSRYIVKPQTWTWYIDPFVLKIWFFRNLSKMDILKRNDDRPQHLKPDDWWWLQIFVNISYLHR